MNKVKLREEIREAINRNSAENGSDTPDWILADYLMNCLYNFDQAVLIRNRYYNYPCNSKKIDHDNIRGDVLAPIPLEELINARMEKK